MMRYLIFLIFILLIASCTNDQEEEITIPNTIPTPIIQTQPPYFPNTIGDHWKYKLTHGSYIDTVDVEIISNGILPNGDSAKIWKYTYKYPFQTVFDTTWITQTNDSIIVYNNPCWVCIDPMPYPKFKYVLPLVVGNHWSNDPWISDTTEILGFQNVIVPADTFTSTFLIARTLYYVVNTQVDDTINFKEHVGIVKISQFQYGWGPGVGNGIWELLSYTVN